MTLKEDLDILEQLDSFSPEDIFDMIIIGSGPAGMSAALCAGRAKLKVLMIDPIDGTSNYAKGRSHYCVNIGCVYQGKPFISLVAIPAENKILAANSVALQSDLSFKSAICSEFYSARLQDQAFFDQINDRLNKTIFRTMALGYSLSKMYEGHCDVFYKSNVKLWDIMAPAALLYFHQQDYWDIEIMTYEGDIFSPFSNEARYLHYLNERHQDNQRVGLFTVTKSSDPSSKQIIRECIYG